MITYIGVSQCAGPRGPLFEGEVDLRTPLPRKKIFIYQVCEMVYVFSILAISNESSYDDIGYIVKQN